MARKRLSMLVRILQAVLRVLALVTSLVGLGCLVYLSIRWDKCKGVAIAAVGFAILADAVGTAVLFDLSCRINHLMRACIFFGDFAATAVGIPGAIMIGFNDDDFNPAFFFSPPPGFPPRFQPPDRGRLPSLIPPGPPWASLKQWSMWIVVAVVAWRGLFLIWSCTECLVRIQRRRYDTSASTQSSSNEEPLATAEV